MATLKAQPWLRHISHVRIRPYAGRKRWTWELSEVEPGVGRIPLAFAMPEIRKLQRDIDLGSFRAVVIALPRRGFSSLFR